MTHEKQDDAALEAYRQRVSAFVDRLKADLDIWISHHGGKDVFRIPWKTLRPPRLILRR